jgi:hypothetical protein
MPATNQFVAHIHSPTQQHNDKCTSSQPCKHNLAKQRLTHMSLLREFNALYDAAKSHNNHVRLSITYTTNKTLRLVIAVSQIVQSHAQYMGSLGFVKCVDKMANSCSM